MVSLNYSPSCPSFLIDLIDSKATENTRFRGMIKLNCGFILSALPSLILYHVRAHSRSSQRVPVCRARRYRLRLRTDDLISCGKQLLSTVPAGEECTQGQSEWVQIR